MILRDAADKVGRDFIAATYRGHDEFRVTVARNVILDCLGESVEPDFTRKVMENKLFSSASRGVIKKMTPHLLELVGKTMELAK